MSDDVGAEYRLPRLAPPQVMARRLARAASVLAAFELGTRLSLQRWTPGVSVHAPEDVHAYFYPRLRWSMREQFFVLLLDGRHRLKGEVRISLGTLNACLVHPREVFRPAIKDAAA